MRAWPIIVSLVLTSAASADEPVRTFPAKICSPDELVRMNECELLDLFRGAEPGPVPYGYAPGKVIFHPGKHSTVANSKIMGLTWQGKYFDSCGIMTNKLFGIKFTKGQVTHETSWIDGKPSNAIEYKDTSIIFKPFRDEFREVAPGIYLGIMFKNEGCRAKIASWFTLDTRTCSPTSHR